MDDTKRKTIEAAGWKVGEAADFLEMSDEERQLFNTRVERALAIRWRPHGNGRYGDNLNIEDGK